MIYRFLYVFTFLVDFISCLCFDTPNFLFVFLIYLTSHYTYVLPVYVMCNFFLPVVLYDGPHFLFVLGCTVCMCSSTLCLMYYNVHADIAFYYVGNTLSIGFA